MIFKRGTNKNNLLQAVNNLIKVKAIKDIQRIQNSELTTIEYNTLVRCNSLADKYLKHVR